MKPQSLLEREALRAVDVERRRLWYINHYAKTGKACTAGPAACTNSTVCPNPSHWDGPTRRAALADLCNGETPVPADDPRDAVDAEESASHGITDDAAPDGNDPADLMERAVRAIAARSKGAVDAEQVKGIVNTATAALASRIEAIEGRAVTSLHVTINDRPPVDVGAAHAQFPLLLKWLAVPGFNVWLAGPAGAGKTTAAEQAARALGLAYYFNGAIDSEYKLSGFIDANGRMVSTPFRRAYEFGGLYLFDEVDRSLPSALLAFNAALANGHCDFPGADLPVKRHPDFRCIAAANTWGFGGDLNYVGAMKQDAAFLDRFKAISWDYDEKLERAIAGNDKWTGHVTALRHAARAHGLKVVISPRASIDGARALAAGLTWDEALDGTIRAKMSADDYDTLRRAAGR